MELKVEYLEESAYTVTLFHTSAPKNVQDVLQIVQDT